jgi:hypothetical protein
MSAGFTVTQEGDKEAVSGNGLTCGCRLPCERLYEQALKHTQLSWSVNATFSANIGSIIMFYRPSEDRTAENCA